MVKLAVLFLLLWMPLVSFAQTGDGSEYDLVTCSGPDCNLCTAVDMVDNIVDLLFTLLSIAAVLVLVFAGFKLVVSAGNPGAMSAAKSMITSVIVGFIIVLSAWLIVDTVMKALISEDVDFGVWNEIDGQDCGRIMQMQGTLEDDIRESIIDEYPIVLFSYSGQMGTSEHLEFIQDCRDAGGRAAARSATTVDCRTR